MDDRSPARRARDNERQKLHYEHTLLPFEVDDQRAQIGPAASALIAAATDLMVALQAMPGPVWAILNDRHAMEHHTPQALMSDCVPCQFDRVLSSARAYDQHPNSRQPQFRDPADLFPGPKANEPWELPGRHHRLPHTGATMEVRHDADTTQVMELSPGEIVITEIER